MSASNHMISQSEATTIARAHCEARGWVWLNPVRVDLIRGVYYVGTNAGSKGCNATVVIDAASGLIVRSGFAPR
jgi:hypothetical protein